MDFLFKTSSPNHEISVYETTELYGEKGKFRVLEFSDNAIQGAMDLNDPQRIVFEYPRAIIHLLGHNLPSFDNGFIIGHGIGTIAGHFPEKRFKVAEVDRDVMEISKRFFGYGLDNVSIGDGRQILQEEDHQAYDCIVLDAFTEESHSRHGRWQASPRSNSGKGTSLGIKALSTKLDFILQLLEYMFSYDFDRGQYASGYFLSIQ